MLYSQADHVDKVKNNTSFVDIGNLPSDFIPYTAKSLFIRPFRVAELKLISKSIVLKNVKHLVRAVDAVIDMDVNELTVGDFYYILMWLRIHSYPKSPIMVQWKCDESIFFRPKKEEGELDKYLRYGQFPPKDNAEEYVKTPCDTANNEAIHFTNVDIHNLPEGLVLPQGFDFPRVKHLQEVQESLKDPELQLIAPAAQWVAGDTWEDKINRLNEDPTLDLFDTASAMQETIVHGVSERATLTCRGCGKKTPYRLKIDALSFFR